MSSTSALNSGSVVVRGIIIAGVIVLGLVWICFGHLKSLERVAVRHLTDINLAWVEAGKPKGDDLAAFLVPWKLEYLTVASKSFQVDGTNIISQFSVKVPRRSSVYVSEDGTLFKWSDRGSAKFREYDETADQQK